MEKMEEVKNYLEKRKCFNKKMKDWEKEAQARDFIWKCKEWTKEEILSHYYWYKNNIKIEY